MTTINFIKEHCILHDDEVTYDEMDKRFRLHHYTDMTSKGVYFFTVLDDIMKVGMADGQRGFYDRFSKYNCYQQTQFEKKVSSTTSMYYGMQKIYAKYGKKVHMQVWVHPMAPVLKLYHGIVVPSSIVRGFEYEMSHQARREGHSMLLSTQN
ncbi:hypothetical protein UFOVP240_232 [uncultured Caudovirales phage]|uniref:Uncharacterized protein n=1 Tax=uncultured Caudovirales phage TaxID=2100421 RepID=A0A6J7X017_9CAUD|nr:hypothetical protein UFOVP240_232 [uncultured Caudovirales phage]